MRTALAAIGISGLLFYGAGLIAPAGAQAPSPALSPERALARDVFRELIEIDTAPANGCTKAAEAMAARLRSAGFP